MAEITRLRGQLALVQPVLESCEAQLALSRAEANALRQKIPDYAKLRGEFDAEQTLRAETEILLAAAEAAVRQQRRSIGILTRALTTECAARAAAEDRLTTESHLSRSLRLRWLQELAKNAPPPHAHPLLVPATGPVADALFNPEGGDFGAALLLEFGPEPELVPQGFNWAAAKPYQTRSAARALAAASRTTLATNNPVIVDGGSASQVEVGGRRCVGLQNTSIESCLQGKSSNNDGGSSAQFVESSREEISDDGGSDDERATLPSLPSGTESEEYEEGVDDGFEDSLDGDNGNNGNEENEVEDRIVVEVQPVEGQTRSSGSSSTAPFQLGSVFECVDRSKRIFQGENNHGTFFFCLTPANTLNTSSNLSRYSLNTANINQAFTSYHINEFGCRPHRKIRCLTICSSSNFFDMLMTLNSQPSREFMEVLEREGCEF
ncbi:hypothetical protein BDR26DRAFT_861460, partial [Obelidium mucronatum]